MGRWYTVHQTSQRGVQCAQLRDRIIQLALLDKIFSQLVVTSTYNAGPQVSSPAALQPPAALSASLQCFDRWWSREHGDDRSGSTAVMGMLAGNDLYVANTGNQGPQRCQRPSSTGLCLPAVIVDRSTWHHCSCVGRWELIIEVTSGCECSSLPT